jgi:hypothetical protein
VRGKVLDMEMRVNPLSTMSDKPNLRLLPCSSVCTLEGGRSVAKISLTFCGLTPDGNNSPGLATDAARPCPYTQEHDKPMHKLVHKFFIIRNFIVKLSLKLTRKMTFK